MVIIERRTASLRVAAYNFNQRIRAALLEGETTKFKSKIVLSVVPAEKDVLTARNSISTVFNYRDDL